MKETDDHRPVGELEPPPGAARPAPEDPTILARWLYRAYDQGPIFWVLLAGVAAVLMAVGAAVSSLSAAKSVTKQAWIDLIPATKAEDQLKVAEANPKTPVADWARLQAAYEEYRTGLDDLTAAGRRESAGPRLKRALDLFAQVAQEAPKDSPQSRGAALAVARVHEARNELPEAIKQYRLVADTYKDSPEARQAEALAKSLEQPESVQFYKDLYAAAPTATAVPALPDLTDPLKALRDLAPPPAIPPGGKPGDMLVPGNSAAGKSFLSPNLAPPAGIDAPPPTPTPAPGAAPAPAPVEKPTEATPKPEATAPKVEPPK